MKTIKTITDGRIQYKKTKAARAAWGKRRAAEALAIIGEGEISKQKLAQRMGIAEGTLAGLISSLRDKVDIVGRTAYCLWTPRAVFDDTSAWGCRGLRADGIGKIDEELKRSREKMKVAR